MEQKPEIVLRNKTTVQGHSILDYTGQNTTQFANKFDVSA